MKAYTVEVEYQLGWPLTTPRRVSRIVEARSEHEAHARARDGLPTAAYASTIVTSITNVSKPGG